MSHLPAPASADRTGMRPELWAVLPQHQRDLIVAALHRSAARTEDDIDCAACHQGTCDPDSCHANHMQQARQWRALAEVIEASIHRRPLVRFDPVACRQWLLDGAAERAGIGEDFCSANDTIAAGLEGLLSELSYGPVPQVWHVQSPLAAVDLWRTTDNDGVDSLGDGGAIITITLDVISPRLRIATLHQSGDQFVSAERRGVDAAVKALTHVAEQVNRELAVLWPAPQPPPDDTCTRPTV